MNTVAQGIVHGDTIFIIYHSRCLSCILYIEVCDGEKLRISYRNEHIIKVKKYNIAINFDQIFKNINSFNLVANLT